MEAAEPDLTPSGTEPIDRMIGGLEKGKLYLAHGEGFAKSIVGMRFLIEGLRLGETAALVTDYSPEDAVRRFARLGYDCLEQIYSGRLIVLEFGEDNVKQIAKMPDLTPVLKELRWLIGESIPGRVVFEPIRRLVDGEFGDLAARTRQFAGWAAALGSTTLLISSDAKEDAEFIRELQPYLAESFAISTVDQSERTTGFIGFDKSGDIPRAAIEADQSQGLFLVDRRQVGVVPPQSAEPRSGEVRLGGREAYASGDNRVTNDREEPFADLLNELNDLGDLNEPPVNVGNVTRQNVPPQNVLPQNVSSDTQGGQSSSGPGEVRISPSFEERAGDGSQAPAPWEAALGLSRVADSDSTEAVVVDAQGAAKDDPPNLARMTAGELLKPPRNGQGEIRLLGADGAKATQPGPDRQSRSTEPRDSRSVPTPESFSILVVTGDDAAYKRIFKALREYGLDRARDGVTGLAKLISFRPDLVVLDADLQVVTGFKILEHMRSSLNVPIIVVSSAYMRASDRVQWTELGADYYLAKPFSIAELRHKARQLIARYRGIDEWITGAPSPESRHLRGSDPAAEREGVPVLARAGEAFLQSRPSQGTSVDIKQAAAPALSLESRPANTNGHFLAYSDFVRQVEDRVKQATDEDSWFCIVGCRTAPADMPVDPGKDDALLSLISSLVRQGDIMSVNESSDILIMLADANAAGAKAFLSRLRGRVSESLDREPVIWMRQFPMPESAGL